MLTRNCLYTVNIGNFLTNYSRKSFQLACDRWKCDYAELRQTDMGHPTTGKLFGAELLKGYSKLFYVDADTVIEAHAPNVFDLCKETETLYAVTDLQCGAPNEAWRTTVYHILDQHLLSHPDLRLHPEEKSFNAGVLLFSPTPLMIHMFERARRDAPKPCGLLEEQVILNISAYNTPGIRTELLPLKWNYMLINQPKLPENYINHYGGPENHATLISLDAQRIKA